MAPQNSMNPLGRFSNRVQNYVRYRPTYPRALLNFLITEFRLGPASTVADIGSGTGLFSQLLLECGAHVTGVEPNDEMRAAGEAHLGSNPNFTSRKGSAEATGLPDASVDIVTAAQAFHWFEPQKSRVELKRILKPSGHIVLVWNERKTEASPFLREYDRMIANFSDDYNEVKSDLKKDSAALEAFFGGPHYKKFSCANVQHLDFAGLKGRLLSSSYVPLEQHENHQPMLVELERIFAAYESGGKVAFEYQTEAYYGQL